MPIPHQSPEPLIFPRRSTFPDLPADPLAIGVGFPIPRLREGELVAKAKKATSVGKNGAKRTTHGKAALATKKSSGAPAGAKPDVTLNRREGSDRRANSDRRSRNEPVAVERRKLERRVKVARRRQIDPTTCERDYSLEEVEFMNALEEYKRTSGRMFPTCSEVLEVLRNLGYQKRPRPVEPAVEPFEAAPSIPLECAELAAV